MRHKAVKLSSPSTFCLLGDANLYGQGDYKCLVKTSVGRDPLTTPHPPPDIFFRTPIFFINFWVSGPFWVCHRPPRGLKKNPGGYLPIRAAYMCGTTPPSMPSATMVIQIPDTPGPGVLWEPPKAPEGGREVPPTPRPSLPMGGGSDIPDFLSRGPIGRGGPPDFSFRHRICNCWGLWVNVTWFYGTKKVPDGGKGYGQPSPFSYPGGGWSPTIHLPLSLFHSPLFLVELVLRKHRRKR